ncbi:hypothetical protein PUN28_010814 [Cardiocondyla obscurior]|uniref:RING-type E3 ubiquitin transferase n=1 Tax=Cardiocondyla obscurior TaxID=286306 RepID=A0AAW2FMC9_9HYME
MDTSVITSCSHSCKYFNERKVYASDIYAFVLYILYVLFLDCSLCIRKYLHYKTQCPTCSEETFEKDLRKNKLLDEIIIHYLNFKEKYDKKVYHEKLLSAKNADSESACFLNDFECKKEQDVPDAIAVSHKTLNSPTLSIGNTTPCGRKDYQQDVSTPSTSTDLRIPLIFTPKSKKGFRKENCYLVTCPVCKVEVPENNINRHLDDCLKRDSINNQPKKSEPKRKPLPKLVLSLMKDNVIRKKLKELGLSSQGDRKALENRLQRYTVLYNAECDKTYPRPVLELIKQCEEEENLEKKVPKPSNRLNVNRNTEHNIIEQQRKKYLATNKDCFDQLIAKIKHDNSSPKISVKRNILNRKNSNVLHNDCGTENDSTVKNNQKTEFLPLSSTNYIEDSDSNTSCPLQTYFCENPTNFLAVELGSSFNDSTDQCVINHDISNNVHKTSYDAFNFTLKIEKAEKASDNTVIHEEVKQCNILENEIDTASERNVSADTKMGKKNEENKIFKRNGNSTKSRSTNCAAYSESKNRWAQDLGNQDVVLFEDILNSVEDSDNTDIQEDYENSKQLNKTMENYVSSNEKFEKENMKVLNKDLTTRTLRKRERGMVFALSDEESIADGRINIKKLSRNGLSEANGFNNGNLDEIVRDEENLQSEKEESPIIRTNNIRNFMRKSLRLRNKKISNVS